MILAIIFAVAISLKNHRFHNLILTHLTWVFIRYFCILKEVVESLSGRPVTLTKVAFQVFICSESRNALLWFCHFPRKRLLTRWLPLYWWWRLRSSVSPGARWLSAMRVGWVGGHNVTVLHVNIDHLTQQSSTATATQLCIVKLYHDPFHGRQSSLFPPSTLNSIFLYCTTDYRNCKSWLLGWS